MTAARGAFALRPARVSEAGRLGDLCLRSKAVWGYDQDFLSACRQELAVSADAIMAGWVKVAHAGDQIIGVAEISIDGDAAWLEKLFIDPDYIGTGAGKRLFEWAAATIQAGGAIRMIIDADPGAVPFYRKMGCTDAGETPSESIPGRMLPRLVYHCGP